MDNRGRIVFLTLLLITLSFTLLFSASESKDLLDAPKPIIYGESLFRSRIASNKKEDVVGLVLSGGSARAFAHIGVLKYLEEQEIVPDFIVSNSMGSIVGLLYAAGLSPQQIEETIENLDLNQLFNLTFPINGGVLNIDRFLNLVESYLGANLNIEQLPIPIMIVTEDLTTKRQVQIMEGPLRDVFAASFALPVYFSPVEYRGHLLIDGGIANLVPLEIAYRYSDTVIASTTFYEGKNLNLKNPLTNLNVSIDIGKRRMGVQELLDYPQTIWIRCLVEEFSFMDFSAVKELSFKGYQSAKEAASELSGVPKKGISRLLKEKRASYEQNRGAIESKYSLYQRLPFRKFSQQLFFTFQPFNTETEIHFLRDDLIVGLKYQFKVSRFWFILYGGGSWLTTFPMDLFPSIGAKISLNLLDSLLLEGDFLFSGEERKIKPKLYYQANLQYRHILFDNKLTATAKVSVEEQLNLDYKLQEMLVNGLLTFRYDPKIEKRFFVEGEIGYQLGGRWDRHFFHTRVDTSLQIVGNLHLRLGYTGRYAFDGENSVPIYYRDGFKTSQKSLFNQGKANGIDYPGNSLIVGRIALDWQPEHYKPTVAEAFIFEKSMVGVFCDILFNDSFNFVAGTKFTTTTSFIGLYSMPVSLYAGYDSLTGSIAWGLIFGRQ